MINDYDIFCQNCTHSSCLKDIVSIHDYIGKLICSKCNSQEVTIQKDLKHDPQPKILSGKEREVFLAQTHNSSSIDGFLGNSSSKSSSSDMSEGVRDDNWDSDNWESYISEGPDKYFED